MTQEDSPWSSFLPIGSVCVPDVSGRRFFFFEYRAEGEAGGEKGGERGDWL